MAVFEQEIPLASSCISSARDLGLWVAVLLVAVDAPLATAERFMICFSGQGSRCEVDMKTFDICFTHGIENTGHRGKSTLR